MSADPTDHTPAPRRAALGLLAEAARPDARRIARGCAWLVVAAALEALGPVLGKFFIDHYLLPRRMAPLEIGGLLLLALASGWLATTLRYTQLLRLAGVAMRSVQRLRDRVYHHVLRLPMAYFDRAMTGQLVSRITNDTEAVQQLYVQLLFVLLDSFIMIAVVLVTFALLDPWLMGVAALLVPAVVGIVTLYRHLSLPAVTRTRALRGDLNAQAAEAMAGMAVLQAAGAAQAFQARYVGCNEAHYNSRRAELRANAWLLRPALDLLHVLILCTVIGVYGLREQAASLSALQVGVLYAFVSTLGRLVEPLIQLTMQFAQLQQSIVAAERLRELLRQSPDPALGDAGDERVDEHAAQVTEGAIRLRNLHFGYTPERQVLSDITLDIPAGAFIGIVGPTGSGKTSLLGLLLRFYRPSQGDILLGGWPLADYPEAALRSGVGLVPQEPYLLAATVRENIAMDRPLSEATIDAAADAAGARDFISRLPQGMDTPLGEGGARLSAGEKQLLAIARALAGQPRILLLDEATSHVDSDTEATVQRALTRLRGQVTVIAIAHRLATIREADAIVVLHQGHIVEQGPHAQLMAHEGGLYQRLVRLQQLQQAQDEDEGAGAGAAVDPPQDQRS